MNSHAGIKFLWQGAANYHIFYKGLRIVLDPLYTRLPGDKPHLEATRDDLDKIDYLLLTHKHLDHAWDFPYLAAKHNPEIYAPTDCFQRIPQEAAQLGLKPDQSKWHSIDDIKGKPFNIDDIEVTTYQIGTETIDLWFLRSMFLRPWLHGKPGVTPTGFKWLASHMNCKCFGFLFKFPPEDKSMLYIGNLTDQIDELSGIDHIDVLAIPYCPSNNKWLKHTAYLINRFKPDKILVHHFDNFMNPFTQSKYMNLDAYRKALNETCPDAKFYFSKFNQEVDFAEIVGEREKVEA